MNGRHSPAATALSRAEVSQSAAEGQLRSTFDEIDAVLRVPFVDQLWRVLAVHPSFLVPAWGWLAPILGSTLAEETADDLRRSAVIGLAITVPSHQAFRGDMSRWEIGAEDRQRLSNYTMAEHYVLPKLLLAADLLLTELRSDTNKNQPRGAQSEQLPRGIASGMPPIWPMDPTEARGETIGLFDEIRSAHGYTEVADYYRTIARAGDFLRIAWNPLRAIVGDPEYLSQARRVVQRCAQLLPALRQLAPAPLALQSKEWGREVVEALTFFRNLLVPQTLVELTIIKGLTDGPATAAFNSYSCTDTPPTDQG